MKYYNVFIIFITALLIIFIPSCSDSEPDDNGLSVITADTLDEALIPDDAQLTASDIRVKGFTVTWSPLDSTEYKYALAVSFKGNIDDYDSAIANGHVVMDFDESQEDSNTFRITKLIPGKEYTAKLFVKRDDKTPIEYLTAKATLPYIDDAELYYVYINGEETLYDSTEDKFTKIYFPGSDKTNGSDTEKFTVTYKTARLCNLFIDGVQCTDNKFEITRDETIAVTVINERTQAARDYSVSIELVDNGLPVVIINTERRVESRTTDIKGTMTIIDSKKNPYGKGIYDGDILISGRGNSSWDMPKKSYNISIEYGDTPILDMSSSDSWMVIANYADKSLMRNYTAYELYRMMGAEFSPNLRFVDFVMNGEYLGTYNIGERIKIEKGRLDFPKLKFDSILTPEVITGSYVVEINPPDKAHGDTKIFETTKFNLNYSGTFVVVKQPGEKNVTDQMINYIRDYFIETETALFGKDFRDPANGYRKYLDMDSFIDYYIVNELYKNVDSAFYTSVYLYKPRGDVLYMGPIWDFDLSLGNADYNDCDNPENWYVRNSEWFSRLFEDPEFKAKFVERWNFVRDNYFDDLYKLIDDTAELLDKSQVLNFKKWNILGVYVWPNAGNVAGRKTYQSEIDYLKDFLTKRIEWIDGQVNKVTN
jgi:hypothetical protein